MVEGLLIGVKIGVAYIAGDHVGGWIVAKLHKSDDDAIRKGTKIATGIGTYVVLNMFIK